MKRFNYALPFTVGEQRAENDTTLLNDEFVEIPVYQEIMGDKSRIISGRKGSGKTALQKHLVSEMRGRAVAVVKPRDSNMDSLYDFAIENSVGGSLIPIFNQVWTFVMTFSAYESVRRHYSEPPRWTDTVTEGRIDRIMGRRRRRMDATGEVITLTSTLLDLKEEFPRPDDMAAATGEIKGTLSRYFQRYPDRYVTVFIDSIDDAILTEDRSRSERAVKKAFGPADYVDQFSDFFLAMIDAFRDFTNMDLNPIGPKVRLKMLVPTDLMTGIYRSNYRHRDQLHGQITQVEWSREQLKTLLARRLAHNLTKAQQRKLRDARHRDAPYEQAVFRLFFPQKISVRYIDERGLEQDVPRDAVDEILDHTMFRPRDVISLVNLVGKHCKRKGAAFPTQEIFEDAFSQFSRDFESSIKAEYQIAFEELSTALQLMEGGKSRIDRRTLRGLVEAIVGTDRKDVDALVIKLFQCGAIGMVEGVSEGKSVGNFLDSKRVHYCFNACDERRILRAQAVDIHRGLHDCLQIEVITEAV